MKKIPDSNSKSIDDFIAEQDGAETQTSRSDNSLTAMGDEFSDIEVSPAFKSLKSVATVGSSDRRDSPRGLLNRPMTETSKDTLAIPSRTGREIPEFAVVGTAAADEIALTKRSGSRGIVMAAVAMFAVGGAGYLYVQGSQSAASETVVYSVPVFDDDAPARTTVTPSTITEEQGIVQPLEVGALAPQPFRFDDPISGEHPALEGQSLLDLATGVPAFTPSELVPKSQWQEVSCGGCHSFNQADLCEQGAYYFNHDKARLNRIQHPYGGGYKQKLMEWAEGGCK